MGGSHSTKCLSGRFLPGLLFGSTGFLAITSTPHPQPASRQIPRVQRWRSHDRTPLNPHKPCRIPRNATHGPRKKPPPATRSVVDVCFRVASSECFFGAVLYLFRQSTGALYTIRIKFFNCKMLHLCLSAYVSFAAWARASRKTRFAAL